MKQTSRQDADVIDTYARLLFEICDVNRAISFQEMGLEICEEPELASSMKAPLDMYRLYCEVEGTREVIPNQKRPAMSPTRAQCV